MLRFVEVWPNHPQLTKTEGVCLVQQKWTLISQCQLQFTNIGAKKTLFMIGLVVQVIIREMDKVLRFAQVRPNHPQPTKTAEVCLLQTKWLHHPQPTKTTNVAYTNADKLSAVLRSCNIFGRRYRGNCSKELPAKIHLTVDKFKSFPLQFCRSFANPPLNNPACLQYQICVACVILNLWSMCALRLTQNHKVQFCLAGLSDFSAFQCNCSLSL